MQRSASICSRLWLALLALTIGSCGGLGPPAVPAGWQAIAPGLLMRQAGPGIHLLRLDLNEPTLRLGLTTPAERGRTIDAMPSAQSAAVAFNASFFDRAWRVRGLTVSEGQAWQQPLAPQDSPLLACDAQQRCTMQLDPPHALPPGTHTAVAGTPWLVRDGVPRTADDDARCPAFCGAPHPRTALGLDAGRRHLIVVLAEGRRDGLPGLTLAALARLLREHGAVEGLNLDGGGSSTLWIAGRAVMLRPANEPAERPIANALVIRRALAH